MNLTGAYATDVKAQAIDLTLSINPLGCSPRAADILQLLQPTDVSLYPNIGDLTQTLSQTFDIPPESLVLGNGSEQLIKLVAQTFLDTGDTVLIPPGSFFLFTKESQLRNATVSFRTVDELIATKRKPKLVFIANPGTPTGEEIPTRLLVRLVKNLAPAIVVVDEANGEFSSASLISNSVTCKNLIVLRTFSKVLGLAGLRVAFATGSQSLIDQLSNSQQPFPVSTLAAKLAVAAINDRAFIKKTLSFIQKERQFLTRELNRLGLTVSNSVTNNLFVEVNNATEVIRELNREGVSVINGTFFPGMTKEGFRISLKDRKTNRLFIKKLTGVLACINKKTLLPSKEDL